MRPAVRSGEAAQRLPALLGAALAAVTLLRLPAAWASGNALNHVSGAWMTLADDLAHGTFYRPLLDPALGYGGTRFFPLAFALQAALVRAGMPLLPAGLLLSFLAGALASLAAWRLLRRTGCPPWAAAGLAPLVLAGFAGQHALAAVRGDLLATALALWGLGALLPRAPGRAPGRGGSKPGGWRGLEAAVPFVLAFAAKPTALAAALAGVAFLALRRERRRALALAAAVAAGAALVVLATDLLSGGRFWAMLRDLGPGGAGLAGLVRAPLRLAELLWREDPEGLGVLAAATAAAVFTFRDDRARRRAPGGRPQAAELGARALAALWLATSGAAALAVLASPGTGVNHLVEPEAAAGLLAAVCAGYRSRSRSPGALRPRTGWAAAVALAGLTAAALLWRRDVGESRLVALRAALAASADGAPAPLLSEDPLLPLAAGERPYAADPWMLRLAAARDPALAAPLLERLRAGAFRAVVLLHDVRAPDADAWFSGELGPPALDEIRRGWSETFAAGPYHVYRREAAAKLTGASSAG